MSRNTRVHRWHAYALVPLMIGLLVVEARIPDSLLVHRVLEFGILLLAFGLMALWVHANQVALMEEEISEQQWTILPDPRATPNINPNILPAQNEWDAEDGLFEPVPSPTQSRYN